MNGSTTTPETLELKLSPTQSRQVKVMAEIVAERKRQDEKHGAEQTGTDLEYLSWLMEELGEVAKGLIDKDSDTDVNKEIVQVGALAVKWLEARYAANRH